MPLPSETAKLLEEQKAHYEARAGEYDEWWERRGRYDLGPEGNALWRAEISRVKTVFDAAPLNGRILELAAGTGNWTLYLARRAEQVTVLEHSASMIELNRHRVREVGLLDRVDYEQVDLLRWNPRDRYDSVFFGFWLSHLPTMLRDSFLRVVASALKPGGCLAILEGRPSGTLRSPNQGTYRLDDETELRTLNDGRTFHVVNRLDDAETLAGRLKRARLNAQVGASGEQFIHALAFSPP
jgi:demethylmenaquinone methyltransferase/2-methoxy-6-polyprenyl-1,4-benzoquinol methylase